MISYNNLILYPSLYIYSDKAELPQPTIRIELFLLIFNDVSSKKCFNSGHSTYQSNYPLCSLYLSSQN